MSELICPNCNSPSVINRSKTNTKTTQPIWQCQNRGSCQSKMYYGRWMAWASWDEFPFELNLSKDNNDINLTEITKNLETQIDENIKLYFDEIQNQISELEQKINKNLHEKFINYQETTIFESNEERFNRELFEEEEKEREDNLKSTGISETNSERGRRIYNASYKTCPTCDMDQGRHAPSCGS